jgi:hypothetical protein
MCVYDAGNNVHRSVKQITSPVDGDEISNDNSSDVSSISLSPVLASPTGRQTALGIESEVDAADSEVASKNSADITLCFDNEASLHCHKREY